MRPEQTGVGTARLRRDPNQKGSDMDKIEPDMTLAEGAKVTVRVEATPLTLEELLQEQEERAEAEYEIVVIEEATVVLPERRTNDTDYDVAAQGLSIVS